MATRLHTIMNEYRPVAPVAKSDRGGAQAQAVADEPGAARVARRKTSAVDMDGSPRKGADEAEEAAVKKKSRSGPSGARPSRAASVRAAKALQDAEIEDSSDAEQAAPRAVTKPVDKPADRPTGDEASSTSSDLSSIRGLGLMGRSSPLVSSQNRSRTGTPSSALDRPFDDVFCQLQLLNSKLGEKDVMQEKMYDLEKQVYPPPPRAHTIPAS